MGAWTTDHWQIIQRPRAQTRAGESNIVSCANAHLTRRDKFFAVSENAGNFTPTNLRRTFRHGSCSNSRPYRRRASCTARVCTSGFRFLANPMIFVLLSSPIAAPEIPARRSFEEGRPRSAQHRVVLTKRARLPITRETLMAPARTAVISDESAKTSTSCPSSSSCSRIRTPFLNSTASLYV